MKRQALQQRDMPLPMAGGLYRVDEIMAHLVASMKPQPGRRRPRFDLDPALKWFRAGVAARRVNARLTVREIDPSTVEFVSAPEAGEESVRV